MAPSFETSFAISEDRKRTVLQRLVNESEDAEFKIQSVIKSLTDLKREDKTEPLQFELSQQELFTGSLKKQMEELNLP